MKNATTAMKAPFLKDLEKYKYKVVVNSKPSSPYIKNSNVARFIPLIVVAI